MEKQRGLRVGGQLPPLGALQVGVEDESRLVEALQQHGARVWQAVGAGGGEGHGVGIGRLRPGGGRQPLREEGEGIRLLGADVLLGRIGQVIRLARGGGDQVLRVGLAAHSPAYSARAPI